MSHSRSSLYRVCSVLILLTPLFFILSTHIAFADTLPNPLQLNDGVTGGDCTLVGTWNAGTKTCTLTQDIHGSGIVLHSGSFGNNNDVILDGAGHTIFGSSTGVGVDLDYISHPTIRNIIIDNFSTGIRFGRFQIAGSSNPDVYDVVIRNTNTALSVVASSNSHIHNITIEHASTTLEAYAANTMTIERVTATDAGGMSIHGDAYRLMNPTLTDISITGVNVPLSLAGISFATLRNVHLNGTGSPKSGEGAYFALSGFRPDDFDHDIDTSNTINGKPIVYWKNKTDTTLAANNPAAIVCAFCRNVIIHSDNITSAHTGVLLYDTQDSTVENMTISDSATGIQLIKSARNIIRNTTVRNSTYGLYIVAELIASTYSNYPGEPSTDNFVENNIIENTNYAISILKSNNNIIRNNTLSHNITYLYLTPYYFDNTPSKNNLIYRNSFTDPESAGSPGQYYLVADAGGNNLYNIPLPGGGNYWSAHDSSQEGCVDTNNDLLCDASYNIPNTYYGGPAITDNYPWTSPIIARCKDGIDNDGDGKADTADSGCHTDFDVTNATSYDPLIDNENFMTSQYYTPLQEVTAQLAYPTSTPQGTAPNLLVLVHGCCNSKSDVQETWETLKSVIEPAIIQNTVAGPWEVLVWDWSSSTPKRGGVYSYSDAVTAYTNAFDQGSVLAKRIRDGHYKFVHFVGHSAGSNLIDHAARHLKVIDAIDHPVIHITFLDAYTRNGSDKTYGGALESRDFAEQYVLKGDLPLTSSVLPHAYNFNVTGISPVGLDLKQAHGWPVEFYRTSAINAGSYGFGLPVAFERSNQGDAAIFYANQKQLLLQNKNLKVGDECLLTSATACAANPSGVVEQAITLTRLGTSAIIGGVAAIKKSITGVVNIVVGEQPTYISAVLNTGSPVWFEMPLNTTEPYNILKFEYEFLSAAGAEGIMTVFVDDNPVFKIDERLASTGTTTTPDIPVGDLAPGQHRVGFRLDPFTDVQSSARVDNIQFGLIHEQAATDVTPPSTPTLLTATPLATSSIKLTWATSTDETGIAGYQIFRATSSTATTTLLATTTASTTIFTNIGLTASTTYWYQIRAVDLAGNVSSSSNKVSTTTLTSTTPSSTTYRIEVGATTTYTDTMGNLWQPDQYFTGGTAVNRGSIAIANTNDDRLYQTERYGMTSYNIPLANGTYQVTLHFAETSPSVTATGQRTFNVSLEGTTILTNLDIFAQAGKNAALIKTFTTTVSDGTLTLGFTKVVNAPEINAIAITPADTTPPTTPTNLTAIAVSSTQINLTWATSTDPAIAGQVPSGVTGYKLERCTGAACTNFIQIATSTLTNYANTGLTASTTYRFRVRAYDAAGNNSGYSTTTTITTQKAPVTIFTDTFETALNWTKVGAVTWYTGTPKVGTHAARLQTTASIEKAVSLANYSNITVSFRMGANSLDTASENVQALYYNGTNWITLATIANNSTNENNQLNPYTFTLPSTMNNKSTFKLRFKINGSATDDAAFVDEVKVVGTRM